MSGPIEGEDGLRRCPWAGAPGPMRDYHDTEWGVPVSGEAAVFERLTLEAFQSGLSWATILRKRPAFRAAFDGFDVERIAAYDDARVAALLADAGIVRNRAKIAATLTNARATLALPAAGETLAGLVEAHRPTVELAAETTDDLLALTPESTALSKALKRRGFAFVGPTTMYALMTALGVDDGHLTGCFRRGVSGRRPPPRRAAAPGGRTALPGR